MEAKNFDKIEAYLAGELSAAEANAFDAQVAEDEALSLEIDLHTIAHDAIEVLIEEDLRSQLLALKAEETTTSSTAETKVVTLAPKSTEKVVAMQPRKRRSLFPRLAAAASVAILLGFFGLQYNATSNDTLLDTYHTGEDMVVVRGGNVATTPLAEGATAFEAKDYAKAIAFYQSVPKNSERYNEAQFYAGNSLYKNAQYAEAAAQYGKVAATGDIRYKDKAEWYQVLSLLANDQLDTTFYTLLNKIATDANHSYSQKAQKLNSSLNSTMRQLLH